MFDLITTFYYQNFFSKYDATRFEYPRRQNTPPVFDFKREWLIPENEPVGSRVMTVRTKDEDRDSIVYGIEAGLFLDGSNYFTINPKSGDVFLKESLHGKAGNDYYLFITAYDGHQTAKIEVYVRITENTETKHSGSAAFDLPYNTSYPGLPARPRPFLPFNVPISPSRPKNTVFASAAPHYPTSSSSSTSKTNLSDFTHTATADPIASRHSNPAFASTFVPSTSAAPDRGAGGDGNSIELHSPGKSDSANQSKSRDRISFGLDTLSLFALFVLILVLALILALVFLALYKKHDSRKNLIKSLSQKTNLENIETSISSKFTDSEYNGAFFSPQFPPRFEGANCPPLLKADNAKWEFPRHHLRFLGILGEGCFGQVWKCEAIKICNSEGPQIVAVKTLKENASEKEKKDLQTEIEIMKILDPHPNVVTLLGCCTEREPIFLIMDYIPYGKLQTYLRESRSERFYGNLLGNLTSKDLTSFAYQVAKGMEYISSKGIIHRDLAARNILIGHNKTCKIGDFGFARDVVANHVYERKSEPDHCRREVYNIMFYCWDKDPKERPTFGELVTWLDKLLISENDYIELDRFPDHSYYNIITNLSGEKL
ncbi:tyrosine kinase receptor Cad96Ca-like protein [Dinothrombium tinctorium]|uniref:receptor protein-tyrosine kinase n=1 Tax=Dinothrombium tinctorium TaxID=1965070 RepID=A0A3S4RGZ6_9ACAR|nr:tyrosine kinase receptor Cad96Ca-like protein [Dinothrombium tinctorium]RWS16026.1 tyrosine kinase receptor Cad96Ca-like protein [Dinothrombium tinctorium]RWS16055.1 tyrosine kinase receptor Cad96Ca-like protein [Dinothrombium tinctorium]RWS17229.1 tyrosine kinase receptor Cad96Ca-like protein [Dinothrombium tinctorium]RWS17440.1 tyrosine kinase receptor Cad96Ca-like protein [Dinothrombium tinctorium]